jgi:hypothetical protein
MQEIQKLICKVQAVAASLYDWRERQKAAGIAELPGWALFLFVSLTGLASSTMFLSLAALVPQFNAIANFWGMMPLKIRIGTVLLVISVLAWTYVAFQFSVLFTIYRQEYVRRLQK